VPTICQEASQSSPVGASAFYAEGTDLSQPAGPALQARVSHISCWQATLADVDTKVVNRHCEVFILVGVDADNYPGEMKATTRNHSLSSSIRMAPLCQTSGQDCDKA
jgi:hypothetical protein